MTFNLERQEKVAWWLIAVGLLVVFITVENMFQVMLNTAYAVVPGMLWLLGIACVEWWRLDRGYRLKKLGRFVLAMIVSGGIFWPIWLYTTLDRTEPDPVGDSLLFAFVLLPAGLVIWIILSVLTNKYFNKFRTLNPVITEEPDQSPLPDNPSPSQD